MSLTFSVIEKADPDDLKVIVAGLSEHAGTMGVEVHLSDLAIFARDANAQIVGGLVGQLGWALCYVKLLWVHESVRKEGLGRQIMTMAEAHALAQGCHTMAVDTFNYQAAGFYQKLGYAEFGRIAELGPNRDLTRYWFQKRIGW